VVLFLIKRKKEAVVSNVIDEGDLGESHDATTFSDEEFVSEYGFSDREGRGHDEIDKDDSDETILVSEYDSQVEDLRNGGSDDEEGADAGTLDEGE
jgi:hypothetical protein